MPSTDPRNLLVDFLSRTHRPEEQRRLVHRLPQGEQMARDLREESSAGGQAHELVDLSKRYGVMSELAREALASGRGDPTTRKALAAAWDLPLPGATPAGIAPEEVVALEHELRRLVKERNQHLQLEGLGPSGRPLKVLLRDVYIPLACVPRLGHATGVDADERELYAAAERADFRGPAGRNYEIARYDRLREQLSQTRKARLDDLFEDGGGAVVLLGDPGAGKSTVLRYLAWEAAGDPSGLLPVLLPIAALGPAEDGLRGAGLESLILGHLEEVLALPGAGALVREAIDRGRALLLLDGLDEVPGRERRLQVAREADTLLRRWVALGNRCLISSRVAGYDELRAPIDGRHLWVLPLGSEEIEPFGAAIYAAMDGTAAGGAEGGPASLEGKALADEVAATPGLKVLASTPMLLTMLALLRRHQSRLQHHRAALYDQFLSTMIEHWHLHRSPSVPAQGVGRESLEVWRALEALALWMQEEHPGPTVGKKALTSILARHWLSVEHQQNGPSTPMQRSMAEKWAGEMFQCLTQQNGILAERGPEQFGFIHKTFREYLAARALAAMDGDDPLGRLRSHVHESDWAEVVLLFVGHVGVVLEDRQRASAIVRAIVELDSELEGLLHRDLLLAARMAGEDVGVFNEVQENLVERLLAVIPTGTDRLQREAWEAVGRIARLGVPAAQEALCEVMKSYRFGNETFTMGLRIALQSPTAEKLALAVVGAWSSQRGGTGATNAATHLAMSAHSSRPARDALLFIFRWYLKEPASIIYESWYGHDWYYKLLAHDDELAQAVVDMLPSMFRTGGGLEFDWLCLAASRSDSALRAVLFLCRVPWYAGTLSSVSRVIKRPGVREVLVEFAGSGNSNARMLALTALAEGFPRDAEVLALARAALLSKDPQARSAAVNVLGKTGPRMDSEALVARCEPDASVRVQTIQALCQDVRFADLAGQYLVSALRDPAEDVRQGAANHARHIVSSRMELVQPLVDLLDGDRDDIIRESAVALATVARDLPDLRLKLEQRLKSQTTTQVLIWNLDTISPLLVSDGARSPLPEELLVNLRGLYRHRSAAVRKAVLGGLASALPTEDGREVLLNACLDTDHKVREEALRRLSTEERWKGVFREELAQFARGGDVALAELALNAVVHAAPASAAALGLLEERLDDAHLKWTAAAAVWTHLRGWASRVDGIGRIVLKADSVLASYQPGAGLLGKAEEIDHPRFWRLLESLMEAVNREGQPRHYIAHQAETVIAIRRWPEVAAMAAGWAGHPEAHFRGRLPSVLEACPNHPAAERALLALLADPEPTVQREAFQVLARSRGPRDWSRDQIAAFGVSEHAFLRSAAAEVCADLQLGSALPSVIEAWLTDPDPEVQAHAVRAIAEEDALWDLHGDALLAGGWTGAMAGGPATARQIRDRLADRLAQGPKPLDALAQRLNSDSWAERQTAFWALLRRPHGLPLAQSMAPRVLLDERGPESWDLRLELAGALREAPNTALYHTARDVVRAAIDQGMPAPLGHLGQAALAKAIGLQRYFRGAHRDTELVGRLEAMLGRPDLPASVRDACLEALRSEVNLPIRAR